MLVGLVCLMGCSRSVETPEQRIRSWLYGIEQASRQKDVKALKSAVSPAYRDEVGRSADDIRGLITYHYLRQQRVYLLTRIEELRLTSPQDAELVVLAGLAGTPLPDRGALREIRADVYRFELRLKEGGRGEWRVTSGAWRPAGIDDFF